MHETHEGFSPQYPDERNRTAVARFKARPLVESLVDNLRIILRGVRVDVSAIDKDLLLPEASYPVWMAIFHNVLMNASNAMLDSNSKQMQLSSFKTGHRRGIQGPGHRVWASIWRKPRTFSSHSIED